MLELAVDALDLTDTPGSEPLEYEGLRERYLPEIEFYGCTEQRNSQYAIYGTACLRGGLRPDLLNDAGWWHTRLWLYATYALMIYARAAAERRATTPQDIATLIALRPARRGGDVSSRGLRTASLNGVEPSASSFPAFSVRASALLGSVD